MNTAKMKYVHCSVELEENTKAWSAIDEGNRLIIKLHKRLNRAERHATQDADVATLQDLDYDLLQLSHKLEEVQNRIYNYNQIVEAHAQAFGDEIEAQPQAKECGCDEWLCHSCRYGASA